MKFSVLMSIYYKEKPEFYHRCMQSIWDDQIVKPNEIVLVLDGPLTDELYKAIDTWKHKLGKIFKIVPLKENIGLGDALNAGLEECTNELIARMDTDDIAYPHRFQKQLTIFETGNVDVCSSWVSEFDTNEQKITSYRNLPETHKEIVNFAKKRSPLNHPVVMYKKSAVEKAGKYQKVLWFEDYYLWSKMMMNGAQFYNIQEPLVNMRAGYGQLQRRSGLKYAISEYNFQKKLLKIGFLNNYEFLRNIIIRFIVRIIPKQFVKQIYKALRD